MTSESKKRGPGLLDTPEFNVLLFAALLHFPWEFLQVPLFEGMATAPHWSAIQTCARAALGDAVIALLAYVAVSALTGNRHWVLVPRPLAIAVFLVLPLLGTIVIERLVLAGMWVDRWHYSDLMPVVPVLGVGLSPLVQWLVLPPILLWILRRQLRPAAAAPGPA